MYDTSHVSRDSEKDTGCGSTKGSPCLYCRAASCAVPQAKEPSEIEGYPRFRLLYSPEVIRFLARYLERDVLVATTL